MHELVRAYEERRKAAHIPSSHVLARSKVSTGTVHGWRKGVSPNLDTLRRVNEALDALISERASA